MAISISHLKRTQAPQISENISGWTIQSNREHSEGVATLAAKFAESFNACEWGRLIGLMHDRGKESNAFQNHIKFSSGFDPSCKAIGDTSHAMTGASIIHDRIPQLWSTAGNCIAGHHRGLYNLIELESLIDRPVPEEVSATVPEIALERVRISNIVHMSFFTRTLYSCLVDADYLDTERFMTPETGSRRGRHATLAQLKYRLETELKRLSTLSDSELNRTRREIQQLCADAARIDFPIFDLTVPTGGGKTLSSMIWALEHAVHYGKERIIVAIPYTSIIIQTASVFRRIFGEENVIEHHSVMEESEYTADSISEHDINEKSLNRLAAENWDAPVIVTTNVQLFETLYSNKPGKCRKLHNICNSIVILDEIQSLPLNSLQPIITAIETLSQHFKTTFLLSTASQPILDGERKGGGNTVLKGLPSEKIFHIIPQEMELHARLRRAELNIDTHPTTISEITTRLKKELRTLCIVNTRALAANIYDNLPKEGLTLHLSRMMCPAHIRETLDLLKACLVNPELKHMPVRVVSTQLIEAGVDIDFPTVFRQFSGLDSLLQAAGRCNREGYLKTGMTHVFDLEGYRPAHSIRFAIQAMKELYSMSPDRDWFAPETMREYYRLLYNQIPDFDHNKINDCLNGFDSIAYEDIDRKFRLIEDNGIPVIVNWKESGNLVSELKRTGPNLSLLRKLSLYTVSIPQVLHKKLLGSGIIEEIWERIYYIPFEEQYDSMTGLKAGNEFITKNMII